MIQMNLFTKQKQIHRHRKQIYGHTTHHHHVESRCQCCCFTVGTLVLSAGSKDSAGGTL